MKMMLASLSGPETIMPAAAAEDDDDDDDDDDKDDDDWPASHPCW